VLLDEPSNHLDMESLEWFIRWMRASRSTIVMVTHDRHLLDLTVGSIWEVGGGKVTEWSGSYGDYRQQKEDALALQERQYKHQQKTIERLRFQARRLRDMANAYDDPGQAKRAKSILKRIEQMELVEKPPGEEASFSAHLKQGRRHGRIALTIDDFSFAYGDRPIFVSAALEIEYGQRVCLVGPNGSGKSVKLGDYNQIHQEVMDEESPIIDWLMGKTGLLYQPASELLHRFLFRRDDLHRPIGTLSGGEKSRLQLARLVHEEVNFLLLDEPTNHLDIASCEQLESSLEEFPGTLMVISHDRYFLDKLVDVVVEVKERRLERYAGSFEEWWQARHSELEAARSASPTLSGRRRSREAGEKTESQRHQEAVKAQQRDRRRLERDVQAAEARVVQLEERRDALSAALEAAYSGEGAAADAHELAEELSRVQEELPEALRAWEALAERLEE